MVDGGRLPMSRREMSEVKMSAPCPESAENTNAGWCGGDATGCRVSFSASSPEGDPVFCNIPGRRDFTQ